MICLDSQLNLTFLEIYTPHVNMVLLLLLLLLWLLLLLLLWLLLLLLWLLLLVFSYKDVKLRHCKFEQIVLNVACVPPKETLL